jgi:dTDP-4-dehydrorhamnose reductase
MSRTSEAAPGCRATGASDPGTWLVTGAGGQLGAALREGLVARGAAPIARSHRELDVADPAALVRTLDAVQHGPVTVLNAAAYTDVDGCERDPGLARSVNAEAPAALAALCRDRGHHLVHVSTDYVFDGGGHRPLREDDPCRPLSVYGRTKLEGELAVLGSAPTFLVVRAAWLYGRSRNFIAAVCRRARELIELGERTGLRVVDDQHGSPTWAEDLAGGILGLVERRASGLYHLANAGVATRLELARFALDQAGMAELEIEPVKTADFPLPAERPLYTVLDCSRARSAGVALRGWREAVRDYLVSEHSPVRPGETE